jgi:hypothetical protein
MAIKLDRPREFLWYLMLGANTSFKKDSNKIEDNEDLQNAFKLNLTFDEKLEILDNVKS